MTAALSTLPAPAARPNLSGAAGAPPKRRLFTTTSQQSSSVFIARNT